MNALVNNHFEVVRLLLQRINPLVRDGIVLFWGCFMEQYDLIRLLLHRKEVEKFVCQSELLLTWIVERGKLQALKFLIEEAHVNLLNISIGVRQEALREVVKKGNDKMASLLLEGGQLDPTVEDNSCLKLAVNNGNSDLIKLILAHPNVNPSAEKNICLFTLISKKDYKNAILLIDDKRTVLDSLVLKKCIFCHSAEILEYALSKISTVPTNIIMSTTEWLCAAKVLNTDILQVLFVRLEKISHPCLQKDLDSAFRLAIQHNCERVITLFLNNNFTKSLLEPRKEEYKSLMSQRGFNNSILKAF